MLSSICALYFSLFAALLIAANAACPEADKTCSAGQAASNVQTTEDADGCKQFSADCVDAPPGCDERCDWKHTCKDNDNGNKVRYSRGIRVTYNPAGHEMIEYLCCQAKSLEHPQCAPPTTTTTEAPTPPPCCCKGATTYSCQQGCQVCPDCTQDTCGDLIPGVCSTCSTKCNYFAGGASPNAPSPGYYCDWA